jgi:hypothetical protein
MIKRIFTPLTTGFCRFDKGRKRAMPRLATTRVNPLTREREQRRRLTRFAAGTALSDRGYGRPAQSLDLHLSADAITKRLSDMTDAEFAALEARMLRRPYRRAPQ